MATFGAMKTWVSARLLDPSNTSVSSASVGECINAALGYWKNKRFWFNEIADQTTVTTGSAVLPIPADYLCPSIDDGAFTLQYPGSTGGLRYPLKKVSIKVYNDAYVSNALGLPTIYARLASGQYQMFWIPQMDYICHRYYLQDVPLFSADSDTNVFSENATNLLQYTGLAYAFRDFKQDQNMYNYFFDQANQEYESLRDTTDKDNATGSLTTSSFLLN